MAILARVCVCINQASVEYWLTEEPSDSEQKDIVISVSMAVFPGSQ